MTTAFDFRCPSCDGPGRAKVEWAGRSVRCKHCKAVFVLPTPGEAGADSYDLADPVAVAPSPIPAEAPAGGPTTFIRSYRDAPLPDVPREGPRPSRRRERSPREQIREFRDDVRFKVVAGLGVVAALLAIATFVVPGFILIGGWTMVGLGLLAVAVGHLVGAYAAFCEDMLYGLAYLVFPIYTGYYLVTRFDDLWPWFSTSTVGFVTFLLGTKALELSGAF